MQAPCVPIRTSSKNAIESHQARIKQSSADLKRKISETSFDQSPIAYRRLRIQQIELKVEEQKVHKSWLDLEHGKRLFTDNDHRKAHRETNKRIVSLGDDLWKEQEELQKEEEKEGRVEKLGPDSKGAFVATLLALYKDPHQSKKRSSTSQTQLKETAIKKYEARKGASSKNEIWCCFNREYFPVSTVRAAHIVPRQLGPELMEYIFGSGSGLRLDSADNCLLLERNVEEAFDSGNFVLIPVNTDERPILRWKIKITNQAAINTRMWTGRLGEFDNQELIFKNENRPASRFLYYHFVVTLLRNKRDRQPGWEQYLMELPTGKPFATTGRYMRESMLLALAKSANDLNPEDEARLLGGNGGETFVEEQKLTEMEETEVARRALEARDIENEDEIEDEDEEEEEEEEGEDMESSEDDS